MPSAFPNALDTFLTSHTDNSGEHIVAATINDMADAINKMQRVLRGYGGLYDVTQYGLVGDGSTDNSAALTALLAAVGRSATLYFPLPAAWYRFGSTVNVPRANDFCRFLGPGVGRYSDRPVSGGVASLRRTFNGPILTIAGIGVKLDTLLFDADGPTYTGSLVQVTAASGINDQIFSGCGFLNINTYGLEYTVGGGGARSHIEHCLFAPQLSGGAGPGYAGIRFPDDFGNGVASGDRQVSDCMAISQSILLDVNQGINTNVVNISGANGCIIMGANSQKLAIAGSRITGGFTFHGNQHSLLGGTVNGGNMVFGADASDCVFGPDAWPWTGGYTITDLNYPSGRNRVLESGYMNSSVSISANGSTISTNNLRVSPVNPNAAYTGIILQAGTYPAQRCCVINEGSGSSSLTFAAAGTSNVAQGTGAVLAAGTSRDFVWDPNFNRWY